jgi:RNA polymerase sigma factor (sigma-70 family)
MEFPTLDLSRGDKDKLQSLMEGAHTLLVEAAVRNYGDADVLKLRNDYRQSNKLDLGLEEMVALDDLTAHEATIIAGWIRVGIDLSNAFWLTFGKSLRLDLDDLVVDAQVATWDAIYKYEGGKEFSTFVYWVVKNRLLDVVRKARREQDRGEVLRPSLKMTDVPAPQPIEVEDDSEQMIKAIELTPLTEEQRAMLREFVQCDGNRAEIARERKVTRAATSLAIRKIRDKVRETYEALRAA